MSNKHEPAHAHEASHGEPHDETHEGPIKTPKQLIWAVLASFVVPIAGIVLLANYVHWGTKPAAGSDAMSAEATALRLQRVGSVQLRDALAPVVLRSGEQVYLAQCTACHSAGVAGAPKSGDTAAWAPRLKQGYDGLLTSALKGKGAMGAQGGGEYSDFEIGRAVVHMANKSGGKLTEPVAPAAPAAAAPAAK